jgi:hypothetical protein
VSDQSLELIRCRAGIPGFPQLPSQRARLSRVRG